MKNNSPFLRPFVIVALVIMLPYSLMAMTASSFAQDDDVVPAPPSIGADVPLTYFGPAPSEVQRELVGPLQLLRSGEVECKYDYTPTVSGPSKRRGWLSTECVVYSHRYH